MIFLFRPKSKIRECLSSYIQRVAAANHAENHELWRLLLPAHAHYPQSSLSSSLDICPDSIFKIREFESMLKIEKNSLDSLTFLPIFKKLGVKKASDSRVTSGLIEKHRKFCPICLEEKSMYKLVWQVNEINYCNSHNIKLVSKCTNCNRKIPLLPSNSKLGICPYCNFDLRKSIANKYCYTTEDLRALDDWNYLLDSSKENTQNINSLSPEQNLAVRLLYISQNTKQSKSDITSLKSILQIARDSKHKQTFIHLSSILYWVRKANISFSDFFSREVPEKFVSSLFTEKTSLNSKYSCLAPWCESFQNPGTLKRTSTSTKIKIDGQKFNYYMYCEKCGIEYCLSNTEKVIIERGDFISFAWKQVKPILNNYFTLESIACKLNSTVDRVRRAIIFLSANHIIDNINLPIRIPTSCNYEIKQNIKNLVKSGVPSKSIKSSLGLSYNTFLYYWFQPEITIQYLKRNKSTNKQSSRRKCDNKLCEEAIDFFLKNNQKISVKNICSYLDICPETLRNWGLLPLLAEAKKLQIIKQKELTKESLIIRSDELINNLSKSGVDITSEEFYRILDKKRTVLVRDFPDVTLHIHKLLLAYKRNGLKNIGND